MRLQFWVTKPEQMRARGEVVVMLEQQICSAMSQQTGRRQR
jgi:hypothetical protein